MSAEPDLSGRTPAVLPIASTDLRLVTGSWPIDEETRARIDSHWEDAIARNPKLWNGTVLGTLAPGLPGGLALADGVLSGTALEWEFKQFLAWRDWGFPELGIRNLFGSALILSADGALLYGRMAPSTAVAGWIYPPGGSLEPRDVHADGTIDVVRSIEIELGEETGLSATDAAVDGMFAAFDGGRVSIGRVLRFDAPAVELRNAIRATLAAQDHPELDEIVVVRRAGDLDALPRVMPFARQFAAHILGG